MDGLVARDLEHPRPGFRVWGGNCRASGSGGAPAGFLVQGLGFGVQGFGGAPAGFLVQGLGV